MLAELTMVEQRYLAVREVLDSGAKIIDVAVRYGVDRPACAVRWASPRRPQTTGPPRTPPTEPHRLVDARALGKGGFHVGR